MRDETCGFLGLGRMGEPMATNLLTAGVKLRVWNRSPAAPARMAALGAIPMPDARDVLRSSGTVILMLANEEAADTALERGEPAFADNVNGLLLIQMGTTSPEYSRGLAADVAACGGRYVEAPVSGSRLPAEQGALVCMLAGGADDVARARALVAPMCRQTFACGAVPGALLTKLAVNLYLITMVTGLVEAVHFAQVSGVDLALLRAVLDAGPMASAVSTMKLDKLLAGDLSPQASLDDVLMNSRLVAGAARAAGIATPLLDASHLLYAEASAAGFGAADMVGVGAAITGRTMERGRE
ncbi:NAD(P)-dependent oxidoreductase [Sphingomonas sp. RT2P30]|uniref:NAD(P)-dependent oxidoreductase n=1 Tax=Parasphingomonas halimpatiens TaxID=3096162 RepID=UPI002FC7B72D